MIVRFAKPPTVTSRAPHDLKQDGYVDEEGFGAAPPFGDDEAGDLDARMSRLSGEARQAAYEAHQRSQSSKRYQEMERERKRRQLKTQSGGEKTSFLQATKLSLMNSGLIPLKKGEKWQFFLLFSAFKTRFLIR